VSYATDLVIIIIALVVAVSCLVFIVAVIVIYCRHRRRRRKRAAEAADAVTDSNTEVSDGQHETNSKIEDSLEYAEQLSCATRIATLLGDPRNPTTIVGHMPFRLPVHHNPMKVCVLPRINLFSSVRPIDRDGGYTTHFPRPWSDEYYYGQIGDDDGYTHHLSHHSEDELEDSTCFQLRHGPFGGITPRFRSEFGCSQSTLLRGGYGFLTSSVDSDDIETNQQGRTDFAAASQQSDGGRSVLANLRHWRRQRDGRRRAPGGEMQLPQ